MRNMTRLLPLLLIVSCGPSLSEKAAKMEGQGDLDGAVNTYIRALQKNRDDTAVRAALQRSGQRLLTRRLEVAEETRERRGPVAAYARFAAAMRLNRKIQRVGVDLRVPAEIHTVWASVKNAKAEDLYRIADDHSRSGRHASAERVFDEILDIIPGYRDTGARRKDAIYANTKGLMARELWRDAYASLDKIPYYKDARDLRLKVLEAGRVSIAVVTHTGSRVDGRLRTKLLAALAQDSDPFREFRAPTVEQLANVVSDFTVHVHVVGADTSIGYTVREKKGWIWDDSGLVPKTSGAFGKKDSVRILETTYQEIEERIEAKVVIGLEITKGPAAVIHSSDTLTDTEYETRKFKYYDGDLAYLYTKEPDRLNPKKHRARKRDFKHPDYRSGEIYLHDPLDDLVPRVVRKILALAPSSGRAH